MRKELTASIFAAFNFMILKIKGVINSIHVYA